MKAETKDAFPTENVPPVPNFQMGFEMREAASPARRTARPWLVLRFVLVLAFVSGVSKQVPAQESANRSVTSQDSFDVPLKKKVVDFGPSPYYGRTKLRFRPRVKLTCYFYATFMVKEFDEGQKGAEWQAIAPVNAQTKPSCTRSHAAGEKVIEDPEWSGYFSGVKGNLVFFDASDGTHGGMWFVVYDSRTGTQIFEDSSILGTLRERMVQTSSFYPMRVIEGKNGQVFLRYLRVVEADCDLHSEGASCWEQVSKKLGLQNTELPVCTGYKNDSPRWESSVAYPVEVSLFPKPVIKTIPGPIKCWPVD